MSHLKVINACRGPIHRFESLKRKIYNCNASIYFNQQCLKNKLVPTYANIKIPNTSPAHKHTQRKITNIRIRDEIRYLHAKKQHLNTQLYHLHLSLANTWNNTWQYIQSTIDRKLQREIQIKYQNLERKLDRLKQTQTKPPQQIHPFHPRVVNNTDISFSKDEMDLLQKGLKYNLHSKRNNWIQTLALEAETAISKLPTADRDVYRKLVAERIGTLQQNNPRPNHNTHPESITIKAIKTKLQENEAMIAKADKGNAIVILPTQQYDSKIQDFIRTNAFHTSSTNPTKTFQSKIRKTVNDSKILIPREARWKYINLNPSAPTIKGLIKIHKTDQPIRPVVNWRSAPAYKLAQLFTQKIRQLAPLPNIYNIDKTRDLICKMKDTPILPQFALASLDITNLYTNIPIAETQNILSNTLKQNSLDPHTQRELLSWYNTITKQNYFMNNGNILIQEDGLAMGAPSSGLIAEFFLQYIEHTHLTRLST
jgi:hypothetical protein